MNKLYIYVVVVGCTYLNFSLAEGHVLKLVSGEMGCTLLLQCLFIFCVTMVKLTLGCYSYIPQISLYNCLVTNLSRIILKIQHEVSSLWLFEIITMLPKWLFTIVVKQIWLPVLLLDITDCGIKYWIVRFHWGDS